MSIAPVRAYLRDALGEYYASISAAGALKVDGSGATQPVTGPISAAYPSGAPIRVGLYDGPQLDSFGRHRVSNPQGLFDGQFTFNLLPLQYEPITSGSGATITHDSTNRCALMTFSSTPTGGKAYMQSYEWIRYQPGRSQAAAVTFSFKEAVADVVKFAGLGDGTNGIEFRLNGTTKQFALLSSTGNGNNIVAQADWNLDKLTGAGGAVNPSGVTLDITKSQIFALDLQALYVGRVRVGFVIDGALIYCHEFDHANRVELPYIANASLPVRCGMTCTATVSTTMRFICSAVISEGGQEENGGVPNSCEGTAIAANGSYTHILSLRPKTTFNSIPNRIKLVLDSVELLVTGNNPVIWQMVIGQGISGTTSYNDVNTAYSAFEYNSAGTLNGIAAIALQQGYCAASNQSKSVANPKITGKIPITLDAAGAVRSLGTLSILVQGVGGTSACRATLNWRELR